ncbi:PIN/TRAM domain-containing protein [Patescibacteria group bacterium]
MKQAKGTKKKPQKESSKIKKESSKKEKKTKDITDRPNPGEFAKVVAREIVKNLSTIGKLRPFSKELQLEELKDLHIQDTKPLMVVDTSILVDGRILPIVNSGFLTGTLLIPEFVLGEVQHIADSSDSLRRAKGRRGLDIVNKLKSQKQNSHLITKIVKDDVASVKEIDHKLSALAKLCKAHLLTVDFNLAQYARAQGVKVLNINDLAQALKLSIVPGEELTIKITHEGKEKEQGVGYLVDGTMIVIDNARDKVNTEVTVVVSRVHQTSAGQLFFARLK